MPDELIANYWTISGPVEVHFGREWSLFDLQTRCEHAARVGFSGIGIWHADLEHMLSEGKSFADLRAILDEYGMRDLELEFLGDWFLDPGDERRVAADKTRAMIFEAAAALPVHHIKAGNLAGNGDRPAARRRRVRRAVRRRGEPHRRDDHLRVHAVRLRREHARQRSGGRSKEPMRRTAGWHSTRGTSGSSASSPRSSGGSRRSSSPGSSSATARSGSPRSGSTR